jgi:hypothetical protein
MALISSWLTLGGSCWRGRCPTRQHRQTAGPPPAQQPRRVQHGCAPQPPCRRSQPSSGRSRPHLGPGRRSGPRATVDPRRWRRAWRPPAQMGDGASAPHDRGPHKTSDNQPADRPSDSPGADGGHRPQVVRGGAALPARHDRPPAHRCRSLNGLAREATATGPRAPRGQRRAGPLQPGLAESRPADSSSDALSCSARWS